MPALIAAGVSAGGGVLSSLFGKHASKSAASTQANAANEAAQLAMQQYQQTRADLQPYNNAGQGAIPQISGIYSSGDNILTRAGLPGLVFQPTQAQLEATPGYQFDLSQGLKSVQNSATARGLGISGAAMKGAADYATGLANRTLTTQAGIFNQNLQNVLNPLQWQASLGENAAAQTGDQGVKAIGNAGNALIGAGNAQAAGTVGSANALASGVNSLASTPTNYLLYNNLFGSSGAGVDQGTWS